MSNKEPFHSTVGQLVDLLKTLPQDLPVLTSGYENGYENGFENFYEPTIIKVKHKPEKPYYDGEFQVAEDGDVGAFDAVVIRRVVRVE